MAFRRPHAKKFLSAQRVGSDGVTRESTGAAGCIPLPTGDSLTYANNVVQHLRSRYRQHALHQQPQRRHQHHQELRVVMKLGYFDCCKIHAS